MKTYSDYCKQQFAKLTPADQVLFDDIILGLMSRDWIIDGGNANTFFTLHKGEAQIKIFRLAESPAVIRICFSAPPEKPEEWVREAEK